MVKSRTAFQTANLEVQLLKQRVAHQQLSPLFQSFQLPAPPALETIQDQSIRQRLISHHKQIIQRTQSEMMLIHIGIAEVKKSEAGKQFNEDHKQFYFKLRTTCNNVTLRRSLSDIMNERLNLIDQRLQTLLDLKVRFFVKAPTVNKH